MKKRFQLFCIINIFIITILLCGLSYGYLSLRILGNSSSKLLSLTSKKVSVTYKEISNTSSGDTISPGYEYLKIFTATNTGNVEVKYHIYLDEVENDFIRTQDIKYALYRRAGNNTINVNSLDDDDIVMTGFLPKTNNYILLNQIINKPNDSYTYALKINYLTSSENQDIDDGHLFGFKVQLSTEIKNLFKNDTLAYNILNNSMNKRNDTEFVITPKTKVAEESSLRVETGKYVTESISTENLSDEYYSFWLVGDTESDAGHGSEITSYDDAVGKYVYDDCSRQTKYLESYDSDTSTLYFKVKQYNYEKNMSVTFDDYGLSYYYRGNVEDNYVNFANMCFRIVRISGDGSVKLILEDQDSTCPSSDGNWDISKKVGGTEKTGGYSEMNGVFKNFQT